MFRELKCSSLKMVLERVYYTLLKEADEAFSIFKINLNGIKINITECMNGNEKMRVVKDLGENIDPFLITPCQGSQKAELIQDLNVYGNNSEGDKISAIEFRALNFKKVTVFQTRFERKIIPKDVLQNEIIEIQVFNNKKKGYNRPGFGKIENFQSLF
jgi:hypothetical protein